MPNLSRRMPGNSGQAPSTRTASDFQVNSNGIFNPIFAFYGGPLYASFGLLMRLLGGSATAALDVFVVLALAAAYGGSVWISRQCGLSGLLAHVPAIVVVTAPYYLSNVYGRGDLPEFVALSMIPLIVAA